MNMKTLTETSTFRVLSLLLCFCFFIPAMNVSASSLQADKFKVSGIVKDATGEPVIGASVVEKGTTNGTVTDLDGNFNLSVASNSTIVISFIGYSDQEFHISKDNMVLNVNLKEDTEMIDEVVVGRLWCAEEGKSDGFCCCCKFQGCSFYAGSEYCQYASGSFAGCYVDQQWCPGRS